MNEAQENQIKAGLARDLDRAVQGINGMSKFNSAADITKAALAKANLRAEKLMKRAQAFSEKSDQVFDRYDQHFDAEEKAMSEAEDGINQLSNGGPPLGNE